MEIDEAMIKFRIASREVFNNYFRVFGPREQALAMADRFSDIEALLFERLVLEPLEFPIVRYGGVQSNIRVKIRFGKHGTIMLNREINSGYWDHPVKEFTTDVELLFVSFFDFDPIVCCDNQYVMVQVHSWPQHEDLIGKRALVEAAYMSYGIGAV